MSDPESLVERLTSCADYFEKFYGRTQTVECIREAAAELSTLRSRCETLEAERDAAQNMFWHVKDRADALQAARDEAVAALEPFAEMAKAVEPLEGGLPNPAAWDGTLKFKASNLRRALAVVQETRR